jgi:ribokinase
MITVVGSINMDLVVKTDIFPKQGETTLGNLFTTVPGGKGANQAVAAARLGSTVSIVGCVGNDSFGEPLKQNLEEQQVITTHVRQLDEVSTGIANILLSEGDNRIIVVPGANEKLTKSMIRKAEPQLKASKLVMIQLEIPREAIEETLEICAEHNVPVLCNPAPAQQFDIKWMDKITYLTPNEHECEVIFEANFEDVANRYPNKVIVTLGKEGALYSTGQKIVHCSGIPSAVVDTTGAGDTFNGALAHLLIQSDGLDKAVAFANAAGSLSVEKFGAQGGMPSHNEVLGRLGGMKK